MTTSEYWKRTSQLAAEFCDGPPPFNLTRLLRHFNVREVRERQLDHDARLVRINDDEYRIDVNTLVSGARRRLSVAHEIAHLIIAQVDQSTTFADDANVEALCNDLAGVLLVPDNAVQEYFSRQAAFQGWKTGLTCAAVLGASKEFGVSVEVMARRLFRDLSLRPDAVAIVWRKEREQAPLSIASSWAHTQSRLFIPRRKTAPGESVVLRAYSKEGTFRSFEVLNFGSLRGQFEHQAAGFMSFALRDALPPDRAVLSIVEGVPLGGLHREPTQTSLAFADC